MDKEAKEKSKALQLKYDYITDEIDKIRNLQTQLSSQLRNLADMREQIESEYVWFNIQQAIEDEKILTCGHDHFAADRTCDDCKQPLEQWQPYFGKQKLILTAKEKKFAEDIKWSIDSNRLKRIREERIKQEKKKRK